ncbi:MAG: pyrroloquinoline quinone biosynthesis protein PqqB [Candidatus Korobacteraceae bacterium]
MIIKLLGTAAGGGFPQWNCGCHNCSGVRAGRIRATPRLQLQVAVSLDGVCWMLLNASPDLRGQIEATPELHARGLRGTPIEGVVLTSGDLDQVLGLLLLRELTPLRIYSSASVRRIVREDNAFFHMLSQSPEQSRWTDICPQQPFAPLAGLCCRAIALGGGYPHWVPKDRGHTLNPGESVFGLVLESKQAGAERAGQINRLAYMPAMAHYTDELLAELDLCDAVLLDGTFWSDDELQRVDPAARTARQMGHVPLGGPGGVLEAARELRRPRKIFVHINNTNPILDEDSPQFAEAKSAGWEVAKDGWTLGC